MSKWHLCGRRCLTGIDFSSLCPWDSQPQIQRNHFAGWGDAAGQIGLWFCVGALAVKSKRAGPGREWAGPGRTGWGFTLWPPPCLWQTLHWIISPPENLPSPMSSRGGTVCVRAQPSSFSMDVCSCITGWYMKICWMTNNIYQTLLSCLDLGMRLQFYVCKTMLCLIHTHKNIKQNRENYSLLSQLLTHVYKGGRGALISVTTKGFLQK